MTAFTDVYDDDFRVEAVTVLGNGRYRVELNVLRGQCTEGMTLTSSALDTWLILAQEAVGVWVLEGNESPVAGEVLVNMDLLSELSELDHVEATGTLLHPQGRNALESLTDQERQIIELSFGLLDGRPSSVSDIGALMHLTDTEVTARLDAALDRLRRT